MTVAQPAWRRWLITGIVVAGAVAGITGVISYNHGLAIARDTGNAGLVSYLLPLVPDLSIAMSSLILFVASMADGDGADRPKPAVVAMAGGIGWTVAQNVAAGWHQGWGARVIDAGVPLALVLTFELLLWLFRRFRRLAPASPAEAAGGDPQAPQPLDTMAALRALLDSASSRDLAFTLGVDRNRLLAWDRRLAASAEEADEPAESDDRQEVPAGV